MASEASSGSRGRARRDPPADAELTVTLEHGRWRHFGWTVGGAVVGALLVWKLGTVGKVVGALLVVLGVVNLVRFVRTLLQPAGAIEVNQSSVRLPLGLCRKGSTTVPLERVRTAFFLRRSVPWTVTGPLLVIETDERVFTYPRDWFGSDSDQRRVAQEIHRRRSPDSPAR